MMADVLKDLAEVWERDVPRLLGAMRANGLWETSGLARFFASSPPAVHEIEALVGEVLPEAGEEEVDQYVPYIQEAVAASQRDRRRQSFVRAITPVWEVAAEELRRKRVLEEEEYEKLFERQRLGKALRSVPPRPATGRSGTQSREARELDGDPQAREKGESRSRDRWISLMSEYMKEDGVEGVHPKLLAAGRRAATLRSRLLTWKPFRSWMRSTRGTTRPRGPEDYIEYLLLRADEPCSRGTLDGVLALFSFIEGLYGRGKGARWVDTPYYQSAAKEIRSGLTLRLDGKEVRKALRPTWELLTGLERMVMDVDAAMYERVLAWYATVSSWCMFRFDDHRGWITGSLNSDPQGWTWDLVRTKTTGRGKASELRPAALSAEAYILDKEWFTTGYSLLMKISPGERDFLLTIPPVDGDERAVPREIGYEEYVCRLRSMLSGIWLGDGQLGRSLSELYSAHSWRFFLPSAASALGYTQEHVNTLGTWSVKGGAGYNKLAKERVRQVQQKVAEAGRVEAGRKDIFGDRLDQHETIKRLVERGLDDEAARMVARRLIRNFDKSECSDSARAGDTLPESTGASSGNTGASSSSSSVIDHKDAVSRAAEHRGSGRLPEGVSGYVVSIVGRGKWRSLHYLGLCHRVPGIDYLDYQLYGQDPPSSEQYDKVCRKCWPQGMQDMEAPGDESEAEGGDSNNSDSSTA